ncbi:hypothetical protein AGOR_G00248300 [Albula goreensis]|uniref:Uncharacterized protein n=1 Tax=Albula goreensis TaxID=1534307 RepID=A0A8T3CBL7_9TELE|nr:hypothetical protein AGOR_G00248300 [Albula goreensis]
MDDDDFGGFEAAETIEGGDSVAQLPISPAIPWAALSSVPGMKLPTNAPPDILLDQHPSYQSESPEPGPLGSPPEQHQVFPSHDGPAVAPQVVSSESPESAKAQETHSQMQQVLSSLQAQLSATEAEKDRIKQDLEEMMVKHAKMEELFQTEKGADAEFHRSRYAKLQRRTWPARTALAAGASRAGRRGDRRAEVRWLRVSQVPVNSGGAPGAVLCGLCSLRSDVASSHRISMRVSEGYCLALHPGVLEAIGQHIQVCSGECDQECDQITRFYEVVIVLYQNANSQLMQASEMNVTD